MSYINKNFIDDLISRSDIVSFIDQQIPLKKAGKNYSACCPFHDEKSPSFTVSDSKQFYHCFGCGAHGNIVSFAMEHLRLEFPDAILEVSSFLGVDVQYDSTSQKRDGPSVDYYEVNRFAGRSFYSNLSQESEGSAIRKYLHGRGLTDEVIMKFGLGFAKDGWDHLQKSKFLQSTKEDHLVTLSLLSKKNNKCFDFFRNRLMFPIRDRRGRFLAFGGRVLDDTKPKYINSSETPVFKKGSELYGVYEMSCELKVIPFVMVVEGYMDVVSLSQNGFHNSVAPLGTSMTSEQIIALFRMTDKVLLCFDGDDAGRSAAKRAMVNSLPYLTDTKSISFLFMPQGEDPDTLIKHIGLDAFIEFIGKNEMVLSDYIFALCKLNKNMGTREGSSSFGIEVISFLRQMGESMFKQGIVEDLSRAVNVSIDGITKSLYGKSQLKLPVYNIPNSSFKITPPRTVIYAMLNFPEQYKQVELEEDFWDSLDFEGKGALLEVHNTIFAITTSVSTGNIIESLKGSKYYSAYVKILVSPIVVCESTALEVIYDCLMKITDETINKRLAALIDKSKHEVLLDCEREEMGMIIRRDR
jgi:DNA primase